MKTKTPITLLLMMVFITACGVPARTAEPASSPLPTVIPTATGIPATPQPSREMPTTTPAAIGGSGSAIQLMTMKMITSGSGWGIGGAAGNLQMILRTVDGGHTWKDTHLVYEDGSEHQAAFLAGFFLDDQFAWAAPFLRDQPSLPEQTVWRTTDGGNSWAKAVFPVDGLNEAFMISDIQFIDPDFGWLMAHVGAGMNHDYINIYLTVDGGQTWQLIVDPMNDSSGIMSCQKNSLFFTDLASGWLTGTCNGVAAGVLLFHTMDGGASWSQVTLPEPEGQAGIYENFDAVCGSQFPGLVDGVFSLEITCKLMSAGLDQPMAWLYSTLDDGASWAIRSVPAGSVAYLPGGGVFILADPARMIDPFGVSVELPDTPAGREMQFISGLEGWMLSEDGGGLYHTKDGGKSWEEIIPVME